MPDLLPVLIITICAGIGCIAWSVCMVADRSDAKGVIAYCEAKGLLTQGEYEQYIAALREVSK